MYRFNPTFALGFIWIMLDIYNNKAIIIDNSSCIPFTKSLNWIGHFTAGASVLSCEVR